MFYFPNKASRTLNLFSNFGRLFLEYDEKEIGRFAKFEEIVIGVLFLLSDQASMINGSRLSMVGAFLAC